MASALEEEADLIYAMRAVQVLLGSGIGLETAMQIIGRGGYGIISRDFAQVLDNLQRGKRLEEEFTRLYTQSSSQGYRRFLNALRNNVASDTDLLRTLQQQAEREEEERNEKLQAYIETLSGLPTMMLIFGMLTPIIFGTMAVVPLLAGDLLTAIPGGESLLAAESMFQPSLVVSLIVMAAVGVKAHTKDPGV